MARYGENPPVKDTSPSYKEGLTRLFEGTTKLSALQKSRGQV